MRAIACIVVLACAASCQSIHERESRPADRLAEFFAACEADLENARRVVVERDLITTLTHYQRMDGGGRKYYLLEREGITSLIRSVTAGAYDDIILINNNGTVVYAMHRDDLFGMRIASSGGSLAACASNRSPEPHYSGIGPLIPEDGTRYMAVSVWIGEDSAVPGTLVLVAGIGRIRSCIGEKTAILNENGGFELAGAATIPADRLDMCVGDPAAIPDGRAGCRRFVHRNVRWIIIAN